jgi:DNA-binding transcriptional LysR family regulator
MSTLTETKVIDQITVTENGIVLYREATRILKDGDQIAQTYHRTSLTPSQDLTSVPANVVAICNTAWTDSVISAYQAQVAESNARGL